jgi:transposase
MQITTIGIDLAKTVFQVHAVDLDGATVIRKRLRRAEVLSFVSGLEPCLIGMEACATSHYWGRELAKFGHTVKLMPPAYVKPYVKRGKNDATDAEAICEAVTRPNMRFVPVKSADQQAVLMLHRARALLIRQQTMLAIAFRAHLAEFGIVVPQGIRHVRTLVERVFGEDAIDLPALARTALRPLVAQLMELRLQIKTIEKELLAWHRTSQESRRLETIPGVGSILTGMFEGYRLERGMVDREGNEVEDRIYNQKDFDRTLVLDDRTKLVAKKVTDFLKESGDRFQKTIVFCVDEEHAARMRQALINENKDLCDQNHQYVMRITGSDGEGQAQLGNFLDPEVRYPVIVTTSRLLSTGVDAQTCRLIVLDRPVGSMTEFKQIVGRGTRVHEDTRKFYFTLMDFRGATNHFADPEFDGEPVQIYEPGEGDPVAPPDNLPPIVNSGDKLCQMAA